MCYENDERVECVDCGEEIGEGLLCDECRASGSLRIPFED